MATTAYVLGQLSSTTPTAIAAVTKAVVAICVVFVSTAAVVDRGVPVNVGEASGAKPEIEAPEGSQTVSPSYQLYLSPDLAQVIDHSIKVAGEIGEEFVSVEHLLLAILDIKCSARDILLKFKINRENVVNVLESLKSKDGTVEGGHASTKSLQKYTVNLTIFAC